MAKGQDGGAAVMSPQEAEGELEQCLKEGAFKDSREEGSGWGEKREEVLGSWLGLTSNWSFLPQKCQGRSGSVG